MVFASKVQSNRSRNEQCNRPKVRSKNILPCFSIFCILYLLPLGGIIAAMISARASESVFTKQWTNHWTTWLVL